MASSVLEPIKRQRVTMRNREFWIAWVAAVTIVLFGYQEGKLNTWAYLAIGWAVGMCFGLAFNFGAHCNGIRDREKQKER